MTRASVLIPIHDKETTLPLTVDTVLRQSVEEPTPVHESEQALLAISAVGQPADAAFEAPDEPAYDPAPAAPAYDAGMSAIPPLNLGVR